MNESNKHKAFTQKAAVRVPYVWNQERKLNLTHFEMQKLPIVRVNINN